MARTEFFETAVQQGFYGLHHGGLFGKKDNVRKYWEDISIKTALRGPISRLLDRKPIIRVADIGCGSGEGYELLTHIPPKNKITVQRDFVITEEMIQQYTGVDISPSMIDQGSQNYKGKQNVSFQCADLTHNYNFLECEPFDVFLSSYASPSHLTAFELQKLLEKIFEVTVTPFVLALDVFGRFSPEWPQLWNDREQEMHTYSMLWLYPQNDPMRNRAENFEVCYWGAEDLKKMLFQIGNKFNRTLNCSFIDRSILVGRHMGTGLYNHNPNLLRQEVNKLFDRDYRGDLGSLRADISFLDKMKEENPVIFNRIHLYTTQWNLVINFVTALVSENRLQANKFLSEADPELQEELHMLIWLEANASRFPVVDFWASIMGPQVACVLRNLEFGLPEGLGCGHGLFCTVEVG